MVPGEARADCAECGSTPDGTVEFRTAGWSALLGCGGGLGELLALGVGLLGGFADFEGDIP